jgi:hypothetical protein
MVGASFACEAFNWDSWDCACAESCEATYDADSSTSGVVDGDTDNQIGEGNGVAGSGSYVTTSCQTGCNVEDCGYDISDLADTDTWDCCPEACILSAGTATTCDADCNIGACDFFRNENVDGTCSNEAFTTEFDCDAGAATWTPSDIGLCCVPGLDDDGNAINCAAVAGDNSCDEACNTGACNNDGGDCE